MKTSTKIVALLSCLISLFGLIWLLTTKDGENFLFGFICLCVGAIGTIVTLKNDDLPNNFT
jgi:hypothetical protein